MNTRLKGPNEVLDYSEDWASELGADTISTSTWTGSGLTKNSDTKTATTTTVWFSGGTLGQAYSWVNRVVTAAGRTEERTLQIRVYQQ